MKSNAKSKVILLITLGILFALLPIIAINLSVITRDSNKKSGNTNPYGIEDSATSGIPALLVWSDNTSRQVRNVAISSNGQYIAAVGYDFNLHLFEKDSSSPLWSSYLGIHVESVAISSDGQLIVAGTGRGDPKVYLFEKNSSTPLWSFQAEDHIRSVAISSNGEYIVAGSFDENVYFFDKNSSIPLWSYNTGHSVRSVAISSNGTYFVAGAPTETPPNVYLFQLAVIPHIIINFPIINQFCGLNAPEFSITSYNLSPLNTTWYTLDGGFKNYTFSGLTGFINQSAWDIEEDGVLTIRFYANDSLGHVGFKDVQILKDSVSPVITIHSPLEDKSFGNTAPSFNISIIEENLMSMWYDLEGNLTQYPFIGVTGTISQEAWDHAIEGNVSITFYAQDRAGNIAFESVVVIKSIPSQPQPFISGFNLFVLLGVLSVAVIIIEKKWRKVRN